MWNFKKDIYRTRREDAVEPCLDCVEQNVPIGTQVWTRCNATVETYRDLTPIPYVDDAVQWAALTTGAWCYVNGDPTTEATYGKLYNWYAVNNTANGGIAPTGWKVPTDAEWTILTDYLGGTSIAGGKMKEEGLCHWDAPNTDATNTSLFTALPGGNRNDVGNYNNIGNVGNWWSSTELTANTSYAWFRTVNNGAGGAYRVINLKNYGYSLRFIQDLCPDCVAHDIDIYGQIWTGCNLNVTTYSDGITVIPEVTDPAVWATLTTGAWCWYNNASANEPIYGKLYNWYAVAGIYDAASLSNPSLRKQLAPTGYHIPTDAEWTILTDSLGGYLVAGGPLKEEGYCHWNSPNLSATNDSLFTGLPGGNRTFLGSYSSIGDLGRWWSSTEDGTGYAWFRNLSYNFNTASRNSDDKRDGLSVRLIKDVDCPDCVAHTVDINGQIWTGCNANTEFYNNGDPIPYVDNAFTWQGLTTGAWCYVNGDPSTEATYGKLYNWYAVTDTLHGGIAPTGYHVPSDAEWTTLTTFLGGLGASGGKMKEEGLCHWSSPNTGATNTSLFTALPGGNRDLNGNYGLINNNGYWWSSTQIDAISAWLRGLVYSGGGASRFNISKKSGLSLRFVQDTVVPPITCPTVTIYGQTWSTCNLNTEFYNNGDTIPYVSDPVTWANATIGAWCHVDNNPANDAIYGKLYNWYAVNDTLHGGIAPAGYHVPTDTEWTILANNLGGAFVAGGPLKEIGTAHWLSPNTGATDFYNFSALGSGFRVNNDGLWYYFKDRGYYWSSTESSSGPTGTAWARTFYSYNTFAERDFWSKQGGLCVRLIQD
jgi:uncharacterized protein (TIGR02145 family)